MVYIVTFLLFLKLYCQIHVYIFGYQQNPNMIKYILKANILSLFIFLIAVSAKGQGSISYSEYDAGASYGFTQLYGAALTSPITPSVNININYNRTPFVNYVLEAQYGTFKGGDSVTTLSKRQFKSKFMAITARVQLQMGEIIDYEDNAFANSLKNIYFSTGIGFVYNHITSIKRAGTYDNFYSDGPNFSAAAFVPFRVGYEFKLFNDYDLPYVKIDVADTFNMVFTNTLDGYIARGNYDVYSQFTIGVKIAIGTKYTSYRKDIEY